MDLTKEAIVQIEETAIAAKAAKALPQQPDPRVYIIEQQGRVAQIPVPPPLRNHAVRTLQDLIDYADRVSDEKPPETQPTPRPVIWHGEAAVVLIVDDADRRDRVTFHLTYSEPFAALVKLAVEPQPLTQRQLIRLLRNTLGVDKASIAQFRKLEWQSGAKTQSEADKARDRLGREIMAECTGTADLPEDLLVSVPVYREKGEQEPVRLRLLLDYVVERQVIEIAPAAGEIEAAVDVAQARIRQRIEEELPDVPVYYGTP